MEGLNYLYNSCKYHREKGENIQAINHFNNAMKLMGIDNIIDYRFDNNKYTESTKLVLYKLFEEFTIISYYVDRKKEGLIISDKLILNRDVNNYLNNGCKYNICRNQKFYMNRLNYISKKMIKFIPQKNFVGMNPSIIKIDNGYLMNYRTSNFGVKPGGVYYCRSDDGIIDTINYILELDIHFNIKSSKKVVDMSGIKTYPRAIRGLEDLIIFQYSNELCGTCTLLDVNIHGTPQIGLCKLELSEDASEYIIRKKDPFKLLNKNTPEKNWLPFIDDNNLKLVYGYSPIQIISPDESSRDENGHLYYKSLICNNTKLNFERFRGSASPIRFAAGWLIIIHEVSWNHDNSRVYTHRFIYMDQEFKIKKMSNPWYFESHGIEFCRSMCYSHNPNEIIVTCGIKDEEGWCYSVNIEYIIKELIDVEYYDL